MKPEHHIAVSTIISGILFALSRSWGLSIAAILTGVLIDLDHLVDFARAHGFHFKRKEFFEFFYKEKHRKITMIFHGWEWLFCLGVSAVMTDFNPLITGILIGYGHHITLDYVYSRASFRTYYLFWRWKMNFKTEILFPKGRGYRPDKIP